MAELVRPTTRLRAGFLDALAECRADSPDADRWLGLTRPSPEAVVWTQTELTDPEGFGRFVEHQLRCADEDALRPAEYVPDTLLWWVDGDRWLGRISIRHRLTPVLRDVGGHIGYMIRPSARRQGHATAMLAAALPVAHGLGIDPTLITCDHDNVASRRVIEANGGVLEDRRGVKLRYWVPTG